MARRTVTYGETFLREAQLRFPSSRVGDYEGMTFGEFMAGPVRAARLQFGAAWEDLTPEAGPGVRALWVFSPVLGPLVFFGVLVGSETVEIAGFDDDPEYWEALGDAPED